MTFSTFTDQLVQKLKPPSDITTSSPNTNLQLLEMNQLRDSVSQESLTGQMISRIFNSSKLKSEYTEHEELMTWLGTQFKDFEEKSLNKFFELIQKTLVVPINKLQLTFSQQLMHKGLQAIGKTKIKSKSSTGMVQIALISPPFSAIHKSASMHRFKLCVSVKTNFHIGIVKQEFASKRMFQSERVSGTSHVITVYSWKDFHFQGDKVGKQFLLSRGDYFDVQYVPRQRLLKVFHQSSGASFYMDLSEQLKDTESSYYLMVGVEEQGDQIEIINLCPISKKDIREHYDHEQHKPKNSQISQKNIVQLSSSFKFISLNKLGSKRDELKCQKRRKQLYEKTRKLSVGSSYSDDFMRVNRSPRENSPNSPKSLDSRFNN